MYDIDYYPRPKKNHKKTKIFVVLLLPVVVIGYWYFDQKQSSDKQKPALIVISEPEAQGAVNTIPIVIQPTPMQKKGPEILERLDEVMQIYNRENP